MKCWLVDGMVRDANNVLLLKLIDYHLKGVSAVALYGSKAAKGVVMITTKRGTVSDPTISVRVNTGVHVPKSFLNTWEQLNMTLYNGNGK